jgi:LysM domain
MNQTTSNDKVDAVRALGILLLRGCLAVALCAAGAAGTWALAGGPFLRVARPLVEEGPATLHGLPLDQALTGLCATALLGCAAWLLGSASLVALARVAGAFAPGSPLVAGCARAAERTCPGLARCAVVAVLGVTAGTAAAAGAVADTGHVSSPASPVSALSGLPLPDRAVGAGPATPAPRAAVASHPREVVVRPGDSLWSIAADLLGRGAGDAEVTAAWHRLHDANRSRVGDPDLIHPGQRLLVPELSPGHPAHAPRGPRGEEHPR